MPVAILIRLERLSAELFPTVTIWVLPPLLLLLLLVLPPLEPVELAKASVMSIELENTFIYCDKVESNAQKTTRNLSLQDFLTSASTFCVL
jgi:hypothetical protein